MTAVLLDTHAWAWSLTGDRRISEVALKAMEQAETVWIGAISFFEIGQKVRIGKWPEMEPLLGRLETIATAQGARIAAITPDIAITAAMMPWDHRDPFDRILAATAKVRNVALVSADMVFDSLPDIGKRRIW